MVNLLNIDDRFLMRWAILFIVFDVVHVVIDHLVPELSLIGSIASVAAIPKFIFCILITLIFIIKRTKKNWQAFVTLSAMIILILLFWNSRGQYYALSQLKYLSKLITPLLLFSLIKKKETLEKTIRVYLVFIVLQGLVVTLSTVFDLSIFRTYSPPRFGYSGLYVGRNQLAFFYTLGLILPLYLSEFIKQKYQYTIFVLCVLAAMFSGAKAVWYSLFSTLLFFIVFDVKRFRLKRITWFICGLSFVVICGLVFILTKDWFQAVVNKKGLFYMLTSSRSSALLDYKFIKVTSGYEWYNYFIGGANAGKDYIEMDLVDLFLFTGVLGVVLYLTFLFKTIFNFSSKNKLGWFVAFQFLFIGFFSGNTFASGINLILLAVVCKLIQDKFNVYEGRFSSRLAH